MTDYKALCAEQLPELRGMFERILCIARSSGGPTIGNIQLSDRLIDAVVNWFENARAALAQPEPEGVTLDCDEIDVPAWHRGDDFHVYKEGYSAGWAEGVKAATARFARPAIEPVPEGYSEGSLSEFSDGGMPLG